MGSASNRPLRYRIMGYVLSGLIATIGFYLTGKVHGDDNHLAPAIVAGLIWAVLYGLVCDWLYRRRRPVAAGTGD